MPLTTLHLVALSPNRTISQFIRLLRSQSIKPLVVAKVIRWIIVPEKLSTHLLKQEWDLLIILPAGEPLLPEKQRDEWVKRGWTITAGVPSSLVKDFSSKNSHLLHPRDADIPALTGSLTNPKLASSTQDLELSPSLLNWTAQPTAPKGAISMLNLLSFKPDAAAHASYLQYGKAFAASIGARRGGTAKLVGKVVADQKTRDEDRYGWDEIALAHYPSLAHFVDMLGSEDYQKVNLEKRVPALRDTCILCTSELDPELEGDGKAARL